MSSGATSNVEKRSGRRAILFDDLVKIGSFGCVVLDSGPGIKQVIDFGALLVHGAHSFRRSD
jgi:hypothetical protein